ncbi:MAG: TatD family hydrolase [Candidatus Dojkabacteria bacterium]|jgi:TatD DNase family protein|nr:TatD family hydrolase [Candidatus Dojkabacteria bacterium]
MHDSHIHISLSPLKENIQIDIQEFVQLNGKKILAQTTQYSDYQDTIDMVKELHIKYGDIVDLALGIHPSRFEEGLALNELEGMDMFKYGQKQFDIFKEIFERNIKEVRAIGECGLDYYSMYEYNQFTQKQIEEIKEVQRRIFKKLCTLAVKYNLPMSIHSREKEGEKECVKDTLSIVAKEGKGTIRGSFHSYTGSKDLLFEILDMGMYVGFNAIITYPSGESVRDLFKEVPLERILFETDGPFLPTQSVRKNKKADKKYGRPVMIKEIIEKAADIKGISYEKMEEIGDRNFTTLFAKRD